MGDGAGGQRLCLYHPPHGQPARAAVVYVHPLGEEMNKARRMAALQSRALAGAGYAVLQFDLLGCGDSSGDFADANWNAWVDDVVRAARWLQQRHADPAPLWLWGLRAGALLAAEAAAQIDSACNFLFWQPASSGKPLLQQFLRLKVAAEMLDGKAKGVMAGLHQDLTAGRAVEIAGYALAPTLAVGLERSVLKPPARVARVEWIELSTRVGATLLPASEATLARWSGADRQVRSRIVSGPAFWQTTEMEQAPALITATLDALAEIPAPAIAA